MGFSRFFLLVFLVVYTSVLSAQECLQTGQPVPLLELIGESGELVLDADDHKEVNIEDWSSLKLTGEKRIVYHLAARMGIDKVNQHFLDALHAIKEQGHTDFHFMTILNVDDVTFGMTGLAKSTFAKNKVQRGVDEILVQDIESLSQQAWCLKRKSSTVIAIDEQGNVVYFNTGSLPEEDVKAVTEWLVSGTFVMPEKEDSVPADGEAKDNEGNLP